MNTPTRRTALHCLTQILLTLLSTAHDADPIEARGDARSSHARDSRQLVGLEVRLLPVPVRTAAGTELVYELHVTNFASIDIDLARLEILDVDARANGQLVGEFHGTDLTKRIMRAGSSPDAA